MPTAKNLVGRSETVGLNLTAHTQAWTTRTFWMAPSLQVPMAFASMYSPTTKKSACFLLHDLTTLEQHS